MSSVPQAESGMPPPHLRAEAAERSLAGSVLRDPELALDDALKHVAGAEDFYSHHYALLFRTVQQLLAGGKPAGADSVYMALVRSGEAAELGPDPKEFLADLLIQFPTGARAGHYAEQVRDAAVRRRILHAAREILRDCTMPPTGTADELLERCEAAFRELSDRGRAGAEPVVLPDLVRRTLEEIDARSGGGEPAGVPTGLSDLDALLGGMRPGQLLVVGARPGAGKTALCLAILAHCCRAQGLPAYLASLEMPAAEICHRLLAMGTGVRLHHITRAKLSADDAAKLAGALDPVVYGRAMLSVDDAPAMSAAQVHATLRREVRRRGCRVAAVDYLQLMRPADPKESRVQQVGRLARDLKLAARDCNVPIVLLSQLNRESEARGDGRPKLSDLRESGEIEQHADGVVLLHVAPGQDEDAECWPVTAVVAKNRNGPVGDVPLVYRRPLTRFENAAFGWQR